MSALRRRSRLPRLTAALMGRSSALFHAISPSSLEHLLPDNKNDRPQTVGMLEITDKGHGYLRMADRRYRPQPNDPYVPTDVIKRTQLRAGLILSVNTGQNK